MTSPTAGSSGSRPLRVVHGTGRVRWTSGHSPGCARTDEPEAARLYQHAADQGDPDAQVNLGVFYQRGIGGLAKDEREAARLFELAANHGNETAQRNLARLGNR